MIKYGSVSKEEGSTMKFMYFALPSEFYYSKGEEKLRTYAQRDREREFLQKLPTFERIYTLYIKRDYDYLIMSIYR